MRCTEEDRSGGERRALLGLLSGLVVLAAGCAVRPPEPPPAPVVPLVPIDLPVLTELRPEPVPLQDTPPPVAAQASNTSPMTAARRAVDLGPKVALPPAPHVRNWDEFRKMAARRMVAASPKGSYMSKPQPLLLGIPVLEIELDADGSVRDVAVTRHPSNVDAQDTIDYAMEAIKRAAPYGDVSRLPQPWKFTEVFLFNDKRQFKPRSLD